MIRAVIFDLWGTLILDNPADGHDRRLLRATAAADALASLGMTYSQPVIEAAFDAAGVELAGVHDDHLDLSAEGRTVLYLRHLDPLIAERLDEAGWAQMHRALLTTALTVSPTIIPGARAALDDVRALGLGTGLISNAGITPGFVLRELLSRFGLLDALDHLVFSDEAELSKPSPAIFERALEDFGIEPHEAAFVGDQPVLDVLGPRNAGLWSVQVGDVAQDGIEPHVRVPSVADVVPALRSLGLVK